MNTALNRGLRIALWTTLVLAVLVAAAVAAVLVFGLPQLVGTVTIDDQVFELSEQVHGVHWLMATGGVLVAALVILIVVPLAMLLGVGLPLLLLALAVALGLLAVGVVLTVAMSPLLLLGALVLWLWRRSRRGEPPPSAGATIRP
jgi:hypothetical protein